MRRFCCTKCKKRRIETAFARAKNARGLQYTCRRCMSAWWTYYKSTDAGRVAVAKSLDSKQKSGQMGWNSLNGNARSRGLTVELTREQYLELHKLPCHYCGSPLSKWGSGLDRKDSNKPYTLENSVPACKECNLAKHVSFTYEEMVTVLGPAIRRIKDAR